MRKAFGFRLEGLQEPRVRDSRDAAAMRLDCLLCERDLERRSALLRPDITDFDDAAEMNQVFGCQVFDVDFQNHAAGHSQIDGRIVMTRRILIRFKSVKELQ